MSKFGAEIVCQVLPLEDRAKMKIVRLDLLALAGRCVKEAHQVRVYEYEQWKLAVRADFNLKRSIRLGEEFDLWKESGESRPVQARLNFDLVLRFCPLS